MLLAGFCHMFFFGTCQRIPRSGIPAEVGTGVCLNFISMCPGLSGEPGESGFVGNLQA